MFDRNDVDAPVRLLDPVDPEVATTGAVQPGKVELLCLAVPLAVPLRMRRQGAVSKLDGCGTDAVRKP